MTGLSRARLAVLFVVAACGVGAWLAVPPVGAVRRSGPTGWTKEATFDGQVFAIASAGGRQVAVGYGIWSSGDGRTWARARVPGLGTGLDGSVVTDVVARRGRFLAVGTGADKHAAVWTSTDGRTWTRRHDKALAPRTPPIPEGVTTPKSSIAAVAATSHGFVAVGEVFEGRFADGLLLPGGFAPAVWASADGSRWRRAAGPRELGLAAPTDGGLRAVAAQGPTVVVAGRRTIWRSRDLEHWRAATLPTAAISALAVHRRVALAAGTDSGNGTRPTIWRSRDLRHWKTAYRGAPEPVTDITALVPGPTSVLALGYAGAQEVTTPGLLLASRDGRNWQAPGSSLPTPGQPVAGTVEHGTFLVATSDPRTPSPTDYSRAVGVYRSG